MPRTPTAIALAALLTLPLTMTGCLINSSRSSHINGAYVQPGAVSQVEVNASTKADVEQIMGQPSFKKAHDDATETWTWHWTESKGSSGSVLFIFGGSSEKTVTESVHVQFKDGVVVKKWRD